MEAARQRAGAVDGLQRHFFFRHRNQAVRSVLESGFQGRFLRAVVKGFYPSRLVMRGKRGCAGRRRDSA